jgi:Ca2+:H+ antiporter
MTDHTEAEEDAYLARQPIWARPLSYIGLDLYGPSPATLLERGLALLYLFIPVALAIRFFHIGGEQNGLYLFIASALAIIPLAKLLGTATEELAIRTGPGIGGLLNATFGNATELIIAFFALQRGLTEVVKASITGSIIGNILFVLGLAVFLGGIGRERQQFNRVAASASASQMTLAAIGLYIPAMFVLTTPQFRNLTEEQLNRSSLVETLSLSVAAILLLAYVAQLLFSLRTHKHLFGSEEEVATQMHGHVWSVRHAVIVLAIAAIAVGFISELLVEGVEYLTVQFGMTELFVGVILVAIIGNAAEHLSAVTVAMKNKMDLSVNIATGSTLQIALFVAPVLVFAGFLIGQPISLVFTMFELAAIGAAVLIVNLIAQDGETNWFEGLQLLAAYAILGIAFFFHE